MKQTQPGPSQCPTEFRRRRSSPLRDRTGAFDADYDRPVVGVHALDLRSVMQPRQESPGTIGMFYLWICR